MPHDKRHNNSENSKDGNRMNGKGFSCNISPGIQVGSQCENVAER